MEAGEALLPTAEPRWVTASTIQLAQKRGQRVQKKPPPGSAHPGYAATQEIRPNAEGETQHWLSGRAAVWAERSVTQRWNECRFNAFAEKQEQVASSAGHG